MKKQLKIALDQVNQALNYEIPTNLLTESGRKGNPVLEGKGGGPS
jgi:hypothetical protein